jgi:hypothetical protein
MSIHKRLFEGRIGRPMPTCPPRQPKCTSASLLPVAMKVWTTAPQALRPVLSAIHRAASIMDAAIGTDTETLEVPWSATLSASGYHASSTLQGSP